MDQDKFSVEQLSVFANEAIQMMDDLSFVERQAWFGFYDGGDGWHINTELANHDGSLTELGSLFASLAADDQVASISPPVEAQPTTTWSQFSCSVME